MIREVSEKNDVRDPRTDQKPKPDTRLEDLLLERLKSENDSSFSIDDVRTEVGRRVEANRGRLL